MLEKATDEIVEKATDAGFQFIGIFEIDWPFLIKKIAEVMHANDRTIEYRMKYLNLFSKYL